MNDYLKQIQQDVDLMNKTFEGEVSTDPPAPNTDPPDIKTDPPTTDTPEVKTDPPSTDPPDEDLKTDPPKTDAPTTDAPDDRDQIIEDLRKQLNEKETLNTKPPTTKPPRVIEDQDFVGDMDLEDVIEDKTKFNQILNEVYKKGAELNTEGGGMEAVSQIVTQIINAKEASATFYTDNEDLVPYKKTVADVFEEVIKGNPGKTYDELFDTIASKSREKLKLPKPSNKKVVKPKAPKLPSKKGKSGKPVVKPKPNEEQSQIDEMNTTLRR